jgi:hypothetical protein
MEHWKMKKRNAMRAAHHRIKSEKLMRNSTGLWTKTTRCILGTSTGTTPQISYFWLENIQISGSICKDEAIIPQGSMSIGVIQMHAML